MGGEATRFTRRSQGTLTASPLGGALATSLRGELEGARWDQGKGRALSALSLDDAIAVPGAQGGILAILATTYADGSTATYCMPARQDAGGGWHGARPDDPVWAALARLASEGAQAPGDQGLLVGVPGAAGADLQAGCTTRILDADQSNTSLVLDDRVVLKCYRRLRDGCHPEHELLEGLTRVGSSRSPAFAGAVTYSRDGIETTVACAYAYVPGPAVGWEPAIAELAAALDGPADPLARLAAASAELGRCVGELHAALREAFGTVTATGSEARAARDRADTSFEEALNAAAQAAPELAVLADPSRRALDGLALLDGAPLQRVHGDLHVAQLVRGPAGIVALDFEGDPTMPTEARRHRASPLTDVASLLLSLDHVAAAAARRRGFGPATARALAWSAAARGAVLEGYREAGADGARLDPGLLFALEVEKEWRELAYAARVLPEWSYAPRLVLPALLEKAERVTPELFLDDVLSAPERLARTLDAYAASGGPLDQLPAGRSFDKIVLIGMGSSRYAALTAASQLRSRGRAAWAEYASTATPAPPSPRTLAVGISASGATAETVAALERHAGVSTTLAVTNASRSPIDAAADLTLPLLSGPEEGGVACVSFQATLAVLLLLASRLGDEAMPELRPAVDLAASLRDGRGHWLAEAAAVIDGGELTQATAPAHRISSALQSALMLREGPRLNAAGAETGDWLHVDVYLTKRQGYRTLLFEGSPFDGAVLEWARSRSSPVIAVGEPVAGAQVQVPLPRSNELVAALVETGVAELLAAELWLGRPST